MTNSEFFSIVTILTRVNKEEIMGRVRKNPEERREELAAAALALFCSQGYGVTQVKDICTRARVAKGTFFYYFSINLFVV